MRGLSRLLEPIVALRVLAIALAAGLIVLLACDSRAQSPLRSPLTVPDGAPRAALESAAVTLTGVLEVVRPADAIEYDVRDLGDGLYVVRAREPDSYPGTGVAAMVVDADGAKYGTHGDHDLAELVRSRGWFTAPPAADLLLRLLDAAYFEGVGSTTLSDPGLVADSQGLTIHFDRFLPPGPSFPWQAIFAAEGQAQLLTIDNTLDGSGEGLRQVR